MSVASLVPRVNLVNVASLVLRVTVVILVLGVTVVILVLGVSVVILVLGVSVVRPVSEAPRVTVAGWTRKQRHLCNASHQGQPRAIPGGGA